MCSSLEYLELEEARSNHLLHLFSHFKAHPQQVFYPVFLRPPQPVTTDGPAPP